MAKPPTNYLEIISQNSNGSLDGDLVASLANMGEDIMAKIVEQTSQLGNQHSKPQPHDLAEMMQLCSQVMHVCSRILREILPAADGADATPPKSKKTSSAKESGPDSDNERSLLGTNPVQFASSLSADLHRTEASTVPPTPGDIGSIDMIDEQMLEPLDLQDIPDSDLDIDLWDEFSFSELEFFNSPQIESTTGVAADSCASAAEDQAGPGPSSVKNDPSSGMHQSRDGKQGKGRKQDQASPGTYSVKNDPSSGKNQSQDGKEGKGRKQDQAGPGTSSVKNYPSSGKNRSRDGKQGKGRKLLKALYLNKLVANTAPKMPLGEYLQKADVKSVCLCGRGGHAHHHAGNKAYLDSIESRLPDYRSLSRKKKEEFTNALVRKFQEDGWRFLRVNGDDEWYEMDYNAIRRKVSQNFRDGQTPSLGRRGGAAARAA